MGRLFGTDGVRGIANRELSCELAMRLGRATAAVFKGTSERKPLFLIGSDTRLSSSMLEAAVAAGICSAGADAVMLGTVPTPAVAYLVKTRRADAGVMISASHNPHEYNGVKIFSGEGYKLPDELEEKIESLVLDEGELGDSLPIAEGIGSVRFDREALGEYIQHVAASTDARFDGLRIAIDCANGSASVSAEKLFRDLGAEVYMLHDKPNGVNINENCGSTHMESLSRFVVENRLDCGLAFDGDADRFLAVDESGALVDGDQILAICALHLKKQGRLSSDTVVGTVMTNFGFTSFCDQNNIRFIATRVGDRFVLEEMLLGNFVLGGEQSGHIIFSDHATTGDGQLTAVQLLSIMKKEGKPLSELASVMTKYPQYMVNLKASPEGKLRFHTDPEIKAAMEDAQKQLGSRGRVLVRPSGTEPLIRVMAEGADATLTRHITDQLAEIIAARLSDC